uniref:Uncharacterized protein n=1 Tax=Chromera velia CCMP2878 TaxID=1169474 RepID=A0A0G4HFN4_9ALVE|eukprot:Cvel_27133.t1-p1 / transcript=Cvel_27133.t1 / gene=Cvel_27133 / organism=Chromera_velia_CCMP2878 / gene_product=hypothetical protein / transcript_product=hypothetical protein / location=Cvel_scaffold3335:1972-13082(+) / protein_length=662 / sequence_SO=supercontig / SO=protein_coding / is_pseudo=false
MLSPHSRMSLFNGMWQPAATYSLEALPIEESDIRCLDSLQLHFVHWSLRLPWNSFVFPTLAAVGLRPMREILSVRVGGYLRSLSLARLALPQALWACHRRRELRAWSGFAKKLVQPIADGYAYLKLTKMWAEGYATLTGLEKLYKVLHISFFAARDDALHGWIEELASTTEGAIPQRTSGEQDAAFKKRLQDWAIKFLSALAGEQALLPEDTQKETACQWKTFENFDILVKALPVDLSLRETEAAYAELQKDLKARCIAPLDWVNRFKFWDLHPDDTKALARTKKKKVIAAAGTEPVAPRYSWAYQREIIVEALPTLDTRHTRNKWVASMKNGVLRIVSSVIKKVIEISKHQKQFLSPAAGGTASSSSAKSLESLLDSTRTDGEPDFDRMDPEQARHLANVSQNYRNHYNKWRSKQNERDGNKRTGGGKQKGDFKGGSQGQPIRPENKAQDVPSAPVSSQQLSLTDADMKRLATTMLKIQQERQDSDEKKKTSERPKEERVRFVTTTCDMETYEVIRRGDVDMVFPDSDGTPNTTPPAPESDEDFRLRLVTYLKVTFLTSVAKNSSTPSPERRRVLIQNYMIHFKKKALLGLSPYELYKGFSTLVTTAGKLLDMSDRDLGEYFGSYLPFDVQQFAANQGTPEVALQNGKYVSVRQSWHRWKE